MGIVKDILEQQHFNCFGDWVHHAHIVLTGHPEYDGDSFRATCFDTKGQLCKIGTDFMRARDEETFPIYWIWPDQIGSVLLSKELDEALDAGKAKMLKMYGKPGETFEQFAVRTSLAVDR